MQTLKMFVPITKVDAAQRLVYGVATAEAVDRSGEICDYASTKPYYEKWSGDIAKSTDGKSLGNVRAMHGKVAAGKVTALSFNDDAKQIEICAKVVDDGEWNKVVEGVYTGFSQGGGYVKRWKDADGLQRYTADPSEVSLVDLPCLPDATFQMIKADGVTEAKRFTNVVDANPTAPEIAAMATVLAKAADKEGEWAGFVDVAHDALVKAALPPLPDEVKDDGTSPREGDEYAQMWVSKRDGEKFKTKAELIKHHEALDAAALVKVSTQGVLSELNALAEKVGAVVKKDDAPKVEGKPLIKDAATPAAPEPSGHDALSAQHRQASKDFNKLAASHASNGNTMQAGKDRDAARAHDDAADLHDRASKLQASKHPDAEKASKAAYSATDAANAKTGTVCKAHGSSLLAKGLPTVAALAQLIESLKWICGAVHMEAKQENDGSPLPAKLHQNVADLCDTLNAMCLEETAELIQGQNVDDLNNVPNVFNMAAGIPKDQFKALVKYFGANTALAKFVPAIEKAGARHSKADSDKIQAMHDSAVDLGATCGGEMDGKSHGHGDLEKAVTALNKANAERDALQKTIDGQIMPMLKSIGEKVEQIEVLKGTIKEFKDLPRPVMFPGTRVVEKGTDGGGPTLSTEQELAKLAKDDPEKFSLMMIKIAQQNPIPLGPAR